MSFRFDCGWQGMDERKIWIPPCCLWSRFGACVLELWWLTDRLDDEWFRDCYRDPPCHALVTTSLVYVGLCIIGVTQSRT